MILKYDSTLSMYKNVWKHVKFQFHLKSLKRKKTSYLLVHKTGHPLDIILADTGKRDFNLDTP